MQGAFGGANFGGFGVKKDSSGNDKPVASDGLLPHEREARKKSGIIPPPPPPPPPRSTRSHPEKGVRNHRHDRNAKLRSPEHQEHVQKSVNKLQEIFGSHTNRLKSQPPSTSKPTTQGTWADLPNPAGDTPRTLKPADFKTGSKGATSDRPVRSAWGSFSSRTTEIDTGTKRPNDAGAQLSKLTGQAAWDAMASNRRDTKPVKKKASSGDDAFWGELENREAALKDKMHSAPKYKVDEGAISQWTPGNDNKQQEQGRRKSRFEIQDERDQRQARKSKQQRHKKQGRGFEDNEDWDEDGEMGYEERERRKEEKRRRKLEAEQAVVLVPIFLPEFISVSSLAQSLKQRVNRFQHDLEEMGFENMTADTIMTGETAALIAMEYGFDPTVDTGTQRDLRPRPTPEDITSIPSRPPIVTIMGHVDHGKTTLLDWLRKSSVAAQEHGGITQHIGAFIVKMSSGKPITFLDTPGHAAFLTMRQRGANVTDIVVLVVAADDSVKPQTLEALKHARAAKVPIIVAINKIDKEDARIDQVKADLSRHGVEIEDYGGDVQVVNVSGKTGQGMGDLEENIVTLSEILDVRAETDGMAEGWILESSIKQDGKVATVLVKRGTLRTGDFIVAGKSWARIRLLRNEAGVEMSEAPPGTPVEIFGWRELPEAGEQVLQAPDEDKAKTATEYRQEMADRLQSSEYLAEQEQRQREKEAAEAVAAEAEASGKDVAEVSEPGVIYQNYTVKADVAGSVEAVCGTVMELGNNEVQSRILKSGAGQISESDVDHAAISKSIIINFSLPIQPHIKSRAEDAGVKICDHSVIYHVVDDVKSELSALLPPKISHRVLGEADVLQIFPINIKKRLYKNIAGCKIRNGAIKRSSKVKVLRHGKVVFDGELPPILFIYQPPLFRMILMQ